MNNEQFRKLILANSAKSSSATNNGTSSTSRPSGNSTPGALGSRQKSSIPMTPRSLLGRVDFARQVAEKNNEGRQPDKKRFRTTAPKGSRFAEGYVDRAKARTAAEEEEDKRVERLKALEKSYKDEEIDQETFERLRGEIVGGDLGSTHLVKGLDFKLLERVRKGEVKTEDVFKGEKSKSPEVEEREEEDEEGSADDEDPDELLEKLEQQEIKPVVKEEVKKKGQFAPSGVIPGQKRSRNQILAEMKAARAAAAAKAEESSLGSKFKKIGAKPKPGTRIETDSKGREVMIIVDEDGNEKRKVRKLNPKAAQPDGKDEFKPAENGEVLGMEVPEFYRQQQLAKQKEEEEKEISIFDDAGSDYDPLAGLDGSDEESVSEDEGEVRNADNKGATPPPPKPSEAPKAKINYFKDSKTGLISEEASKAPSMKDAAFQETLRKAKAVASQVKTEEEIKVAEREARLKKLLASTNRDDEDMDMSFGTSRNEDVADLDEDRRVKLSNWGDDDDDGDEGGGGKGKQKRGGKKRKGDKDSAVDVLRVMEQQKKSKEG
ncbi:hypothetical protein DL546_004583 [Coniochaeta pulveracea]|uniref:RED-like N-terminal domain-containing protein n=1 Tax=Coniochaeta pulveracea TaxID=177199 RepID=A0A420Y4F5_9PEZI|nr:hypothetical protein DL546_004583 [Coniochaeta pulveracea]